MRPDRCVYLSCERSRLAIDQMPGVTLLSFDQELRCCSASGGAIAAHGYRPEQLIGARASDLIGARAVGLETAMRAALAGESSVLEVSLTADEVCEAVLSPLYDDDGLLVGGVLTLRDITAQRRAERALHETERNLWAVIEQSADMLTRHDAEGRYLYASPASARVFGYRPQELIGRDCLEFVHPDDRDLVQRAIEVARESGRAFELEHRVIRADGSCVWVHALVTVQLDHHGAVSGGVGAVRDITAQREAEAALAHAEEKFRTVTEQSADMLSLHDARGCYTYVSPACEGVYGFEPDELIGRHPFEFVHPHDRERVEAEVNAALTRGDSFELEHRVLCSDGSCRWVHALVSLQLDEHGAVSAGVGAVRDITAQREVEQALALAEEQFRTVIELSGDMLSRHDRENRYVYASPNSAQVVGFEPAQLLGRQPHELAHPDDRARVQAATRTASETGAAELEHRVIRPDGSCAWVHALLRGRPDEHGEIAETVVAARDITERKRREAELHEATARFEGAFENAPIGMSLLSLDGSWMKVNRELCRITGYSEPELLAKTLCAITHPDDVAAAIRGLRTLAPWDTYEAETRYIHRDGRVIWVLLSVSVVCDEHSSPAYFVTQTQDITDRKELHARLCYLADHDPLTELYNRRRFESELDRQLSRCRRYGEQAALLMVDLDHFKYVNDSLGHHFGDGVIAYIAKLLNSRLRDSDVLARIGGDEFAIILPNARHARAKAVARSLSRMIENSPFDRDGHRYVCSASTGVMIINADTTSAEDALVAADLALYDAKRLGRNRIAVYSPDTRADVLAGLSWSQRLKRALREETFTLHAQPIVELASGTTMMHELLIRMQADDGQLILPDRFLHAAARFGYMPAIDRWVIAKAAQMVAATPGRRLAVNLAAKTIGEPGLIAYITNQLHLAQANPADLIFEISEADVIANLEHARSVCERLRALGARVALDDFGSGFSGFSYLKALEIDILKIDGQFVSQLSENRIDRLVVEAVVYVAEGLGLPTIAEYVSSEQLARELREIGVAYGQGFHLGRPTPLEHHTPSAQSRVLFCHDEHRMSA